MVHTLTNPLEMQKMAKATAPFAKFDKLVSKYRAVVDRVEVIESVDPDTGKPYVRTATIRSGPWANYNLATSYMYGAHEAIAINTKMKKRIFG